MPITLRTGLSIWRPSTWLLLVWRRAVTSVTRNPAPKASRLHQHTTPHPATTGNPIRPRGPLLLAAILDKAPRLDGAICAPTQPRLWFLEQRYRTERSPNASAPAAPSQLDAAAPHKRLVNKNGVWAGESSGQVSAKPRWDAPGRPAAPKEHEFTDDNNYTKPSGHRICLTCRRETTASAGRTERPSHD